MRLRILFICFITGCIFQNCVLDQCEAAKVALKDGSTFFVDANAGGGASTLSPAEQLKKSIEMAQAGETEQALEFLKNAKDLQPHNPLFSVEYLNALLVIADRADESEKAAIVNEAIKSVNGLRTNFNFDGRNNPETAYHFMVAVGRLADITLPLSEPTYVSLQICQGSIARNLRSNQQFPANGRESLANPMIAMAKAYASQQNQVAAMDAITAGCELGFCEFQKLADDSFIAKLKDQAKLKAHIKSLEDAYLQKIKIWSKQSIDDFQPFGFQFNMDDVEGGSLANRDFDGKILVVDFWATWCAPCREEIPHFIQLQSNLADKGVQVVGISMDAPEEPYSAVDAVKKFMADNDFNYPCGLGTPELKNRVPGDIKLPTTLFIDRSGTVRYMANGYHDYAKLAAIAEALADEEQPVTTSRGR